MIAAQQCPACGAATPVDAPRGLCVECLMRLAEDPSPTRVAEDSTAWEKGPGAGRFGDYELLRQIGRGGMGVVYEARQLSLNRIVALKMILGGDMASLSVPAVRRFKVEAEAAAKLAHPNIVAIHEFGERDGLPFFSMQRIDGKSLEQEMAALAVPFMAAKSGGKDIDRTAAAQAQVRIAKLVGTLARALHYAHQQGVIHCDVKPSNILLDGDGEPHLTDFGIARLLDQEGQLTKSGVIGSPRYMSPEQASGRRGEVTAATDIYGLGVVLYELLTGQPPFRAVTPSETLRQVMEQEPPTPHNSHPLVNRDLSIICLKCLEKDVRHRYASAAELADDLERWIRHEPILARRASAPERLVRWCQRKPAIAALAASVALLLVTVAIVSALFVWRTLVNDKEWEETKIILRDDLQLKLDELWKHPDKSQPVTVSSELLSLLMNERKRRSTAYHGELKRLRFGVYTFDVPSEMVRKFAPLIFGLEDAVADEMGIPVRIDFLIYPSYTAGHAALVSGNVDFMRIGPSSYVIIKREDSGCSLLAAQKSPIVGAVIVLADSGIDDLSQLKGQPIAFGDETSTIGNFMFKAALVRAGIVAGDLGRASKHFQSHPSVAKAVTGGTYKAGATNKIFMKDPLLKVLYEFRTAMGMPFVARNRLEPAVAAAIEAALLAQTDSFVLTSIEENLTGFRKVKDEEYDLLREEMELADDFGGLKK